MNRNCLILGSLRACIRTDIHVHERARACMHARMHATLTCKCTHTHTCVAMSVTPLCSEFDHDWKYGTQPSRQVPARWRQHAPSKLCAAGEAALHNSNVLTHTCKFKLSFLTCRRYLNCYSISIIKIFKLTQEAFSIRTHNLI